MIKLKHSVLAIALPTIVGCSTTIVNQKAADTIRSSLVFDKTLFTQTPDRPVKVVLVRDSGLLGGGLTFGVKIDKTPLGAFDSSDKAEIFLSQGKHTILIFKEAYLPSQQKTDESKGIFAVQAKPNYRVMKFDLNSSDSLFRESEIDVKPAVTNYFRIRIIYGDRGGPIVERGSFIE